MSFSSLKHVHSNKLYTVHSNDDEVASGVGILVHAKYEHARSISAVHRCSNRIMAIDLKLGHHIIRMISIYMPHAGYDQSHGFRDFESIIDQLHRLLHEAKRLHYRIVIGGDFNLVVANNRRADLLLDLVHAFDLVIGDDPQLHIDESSWTHSHPIYGRRQIDFI